MITTIPVPPDDAGLVSALLAADLPIDDLAEPGRVFFQVERQGQPIGYGGFELYGQDALLRSVVVPVAVRGSGAGRIVTETILGEIGKAGGNRAFLLTTSATAFFEHLGFEPIQRRTAPTSILGTRQASSICATAAMLSRAI